MAVTKDFVLAFARNHHCTTAPELYNAWLSSNDEIPPAPAGYETWTLDQMAEWIAANYTGANPNP